MIHMKSQDLFSSENKKITKLSSALVVIGTLRVNIVITGMGLDVLSGLVAL